MLKDVKKFLERSRTTSDLIAREEYETAIMLALEGVTQLEAKLLAHEENEGDECPLCKLEEDNEALKEQLDHEKMCMASCLDDNKKWHELFEWWRSNSIYWNKSWATAIRERNFANGTVESQEKELVTLLREVGRYANALSLLKESPHIRLEYCKTNKLLPNPMTKEASVDEYWRKVIVNEAFEAGDK